uniref:Small ribosomal subunit protein mS23 n=1 Tax=Labrus bergylta TaxID=56723 RepID=A0A3Q3GPW3_9LABR|nr:28S ribosomal protein S23, mitochondrial [Labrus bergylta]
MTITCTANVINVTFEGTLVDKRSAMAGSRLEKFGNVFTRVRDLMRSGVIQRSAKPVWYEVYEAFPPKRDPLHVKPWRRAGIKKQETVPEIFYREDEVRAKFYELYVPGRPFDLSRSNFVSTCQRFVDKYTELQSRAEFEDSALFEETGKALLAEGILLRRRGHPLVSAEPRDAVLSLKLRDMLAEQQTDADGEETTQQTTHTEPQTA